MPSLNVVANIWKNLQELDLRPLREAAEREVAIAIVGREGVGKRTLAKQMRIDPARPAQSTQTPLLLTDIQVAETATRADLIIVLLDAAGSDSALERQLVERWGWAGKKVLVLYNKVDLLGEDRGLLPDAFGWSPAKVLYGSATDRHFLETRFTEAVLDLLPDRHLALGRCFPLLRKAIALRLISETSVSNATYAIGTGLAEVVPVLNLPLNVADMVVLTKGQAILVYKLGLALGLPTEWQYYVSELGGVIGSGFIWRQAARSLIGLVPAWGILPKAAIAYAGTYVVGHTVLQWYLTGRHISKAQVRYLTGRHISKAQVQQLYRQAAAQSKSVASELAKRAPRPKLRLPRLSLRRGRKPPAAQPTCANCGTVNEPDALYCKKCGTPLTPQLPSGA